MGIEKNKKVKKGKKELLSLLRNIFRMLAIYWRMRPWFVMLFVVVMFFIAGLPFGVAYINGQLINKVVEFLGGGSVDRWEIIVFT